MLVTCLKCKKPVFVSSSLVMQGEAQLPCNACGAGLVVTQSGSVRLADGATPASTPAPVPAPSVGVGAAGRERSETASSGTWAPAPQLAPAAAPWAVPITPAAPAAASAAPVSQAAPFPVTPASRVAPKAVPAKSAPMPPPVAFTPAAQAPTTSPLKPLAIFPAPPASAVDDSFDPSSMAPTDAGDGADVEPASIPAQAIWTPAGAPTQMPAIPVMMPSQAQPAHAAPAPAYLPAASLDAPRADETLEAGYQAAALYDSTQQQDNQQPASSYARAEAAPPAGAWNAVESPATRWRPPENAAAQEPWQVTAAPEPVELGQPTRIGDDPEGIDALEADGWPEPRRRRYWPALTLVLLLTSGGLWAAGVVEIPGVPVPEKVRELFSRIDEAEPAPPQAAVAARPNGDDVAGIAATAGDAALGSSGEDGADAAKRGRPTKKGREIKSSKVSRSAARTAAASSAEVEGPADKPVEKAPPSKVAAITPSAPPPPPAAPPTGGDSPALTHYKQGNLFLKEKKVALAIEEFKACLAADVKYGMAYRSLGVAYMLLGREKSAIEAYEKFVQVEASHKDADKVRQIIQDYYRRNPR